MGEYPVSEPEEWRPVPGHPCYEASSLGRVRSLDRWIYRTDGKRTFWRGALLRSTKHGRYSVVSMGGYSCANVHVLVCKAFHGKKPSKRHHVAHWNGDGHDNRASNLRWATPKQNKADELRLGRRNIGEDCVTAKLTRSDVVAIRRLRATTTLLMREIGARFGVSQSQVKRIVDRDTWVHVP